MTRTITTPTLEARSKVEGVVKVKGVPTQRIVRAFSYDSEPHLINSQQVSLSKSLGESVSNPVDGSYTIEFINEYNQRVFVVAFDEYGDEFVANKSVATGDIIHPTVPNGYVWEVASAGQLPAEEPEWVLDITSSQLYGTASMIARVFNQPEVHGPITPQTTQEPSYSPAMLFSNNEEGIWYDPYDLSTMFQDTAGTIPVTTDGDPIGLLLDKSGNDNHAFSSGINRPVFKTDGQVRWIQFNGDSQRLNVGPHNPVRYSFFAYQLTESTDKGFLLSQQRQASVDDHVAISLDPSGNSIVAENRYGRQSISKKAWELSTWDEPFLVGFQEFYTDSPLSGTPYRVYERLNFIDASYNFETSPSRASTDLFFGSPDTSSNTNAWKGRLYGFVSVQNYTTFEDVENLNNYFSGA